MPRFFLSKGIVTKLLYCLLLPVLTSVSSKAQSPLPDEEHEVQRPLKKLWSSFSPDIKKPVKSFTWIIDKDTIFQKCYDPAGNLVSNVDYAGNLPRYKTVYTNKGNLCMTSRHFAYGLLTNTNDYTYDKNGNLVQWLGSTFNYDKKTQQPTETKDRHWIVEWNDATHMKRRYSINDANVRTQQSDYTYNALGKLTEIKAQQWRDLYEYQDSLLMHKSRVFNNGNTVTYSGVFSYNDKGLLSHSSDTYYVAVYDYDDATRLTHQLLKKADDTTKQQDAVFHYKGNVLSDIDVRCSDPYMIYATPEFIVKDIYEYTGRISMDNILNLAFVYDGHGNIREIKYSVNGRYAYSKYFVYEYY